MTIENEWSAFLASSLKRVEMEMQTNFNYPSTCPNRVLFADKIITFISGLLTYTQQTVLLI